MAIQKNAFAGLRDKDKRDRLMTDLQQNPNVLLKLDPMNLVPFEQTLTWSIQDRIGLNDVMIFILLYVGRQEEALELAKHNLDLSTLADEPLYGVFSKYVLQDSDRVMMVLLRPTTAENSKKRYPESLVTS